MPGKRLPWGAPRTVGGPFQGTLVPWKGHAVPSQGVPRPSKGCAKLAKGRLKWAGKEGVRHRGESLGTPGDLGRSGTTKFLAPEKSKNDRKTGKSVQLHESGWPPT